jgi:hypothetical protein
MMLLTLLAVSFVSASEYTLAYTTGPESSTTPVYITLVGSKTNSDEFLIGNKFTANADSVTKLNVNNDIGVVKKIKLRAAKSKGAGWIARNFITVVSPQNIETQFRADYCMDAKVHANLVYRDIFPYADEVTSPPLVLFYYSQIICLFTNILLSKIVVFAYLQIVYCLKLLFNIVFSLLFPFKGHH